MTAPADARPAPPVVPGTTGGGPDDPSPTSSRGPGPEAPPWVGLGTAALAAATTWCALLSWRGMGESPGRYTGPLVIAAVLVAVVGWGVRRWTSRALLALLAQALVLGLWLLHRVSGHWIPRPSSFTAFGNEVYDGALAAQQYTSPVSSNYPEFAFVMLLSGIGILLAVDLLACGLRRATLAGLPLLLTITISASVLLAPVNALIFLVTALGWLSVVALQESDRVARWGRGGGATGIASVGGLAARIAVTAGLVAVVLSAALSSQGRDFGSFGQGLNDDAAIDAGNPFLDLRRNLVLGPDVPLVYVKADDAPSYLRTTVLDAFTGTAWQPSKRDIGNTEPVDGTLGGTAPGMDTDAKGPSHTWQIRVDDRFRSTWLPVPYPTSKISIGDGWRFDPATLDVVGVNGTTAGGSSYDLTTYDPVVDVAKVRRALPPPVALQARMTDLPADLPGVFARTAQRVTAKATNDFDRAVLLQRWFRSEGGFVYDTSRQPGSGILTLQQFITSDRSGYCEQFAAAMAVMARTLDIPARVAVGFLRSDSAGDGSYVFSAHDLHAWPELYFEGVGWIRFEPTPQDRATGTPSYTSEQVAGVDSDVQTGASSSPNQAPNSAKPRPDINAGSGRATDGGGISPWWWVGGGVGVLLALLVGLGPRALRVVGSRRRWASAHTAPAVADAAWTEVRATALDLGLRWSERGTVRTNGQSVQHEVLPTKEARQAIGDVVRFVELTRYARPRELSASTRAQVEDDVTAWQRAMYRAVDRRRARRARWWPRSVIRALAARLRR